MFFARRRYEFHVPELWQKPHHDEEREYRELYIREKYEREGFIQKTRKPPKQKLAPSPPPPELLPKDLKKKQHSFPGRGSNSSKNNSPLNSPSNIGMVEYIGYVSITLQVSERCERALRKTDLAKWLQTATSTKQTNPLNWYSYSFGSLGSLVLH